MWRFTVCLFVAGSVWAQDKVVSTRIFSEPPGAPFIVDGRTYRDSATFFWPQNSKHVLSIPDAAALSTSDLARYDFKEWQNSAGVKMLDGSSIAITADAANPFYKSVWRLFYSINLRLPDAGLPFACDPGPAWGKVYINLPESDSCYTASALVWGEAGKTVQVQVNPPAGWVFLGWVGSMDGASGPNLSFTLSRPMSMLARFGLATRVTLATTPPGLQLYADRTVVSTPATLDWVEGSQHTIGPVEPQRDEVGAVWVFDSWSDGGAAHHAYTVGPANVGAIVTARFAPGLTVTVGSEPAGLKLSVDGVSTANRRFNWASGSRHAISAPAELADAQGRHYVFRSWSNGAAATQEVQVAAADQAWIAAYECLGSLTVRSSATGVTLSVDGADCPNSCTVHRSAGSQVRVTAPAAAPFGDASRFDFDGWSDAGAAEHTVDIGGADAQTLTASYRLSHRLSASSNPAAGANFRFEPASPDNYYASGTSVAVIAQPRPNYQFRRWDGDLTGTLRSGVVKMSAPRAVCALLDRVAYLSPAAARNAAGETPESGLAAGSIISIYGDDLAPGVLAGPHSPLTQTLNGVTVRLANRLLPLFFVSPGQVNALLPSDLSEGDYTAIVRWEGHPDVSTGFKVVRNAPGLFTQPLGDVPYALATHASGALVTIDAPAQPGETVTVFGTGFGPYQGMALDGFAIPEAVTLPLADPVQVLITEQVMDPEFAGAATGQVGVVAVRFRVPDFVLAPSLEFRVSSNGKESNAVALPIGAAAP